MADPFLAEIRIFAGNFAPTSWATCDGQLMSISQNTALFALLGTMYGGDGRTTFALPNLQDSAPVHRGQGAGLSERAIGETGGSENLTLLSSEMPSHTHALMASSLPGDTAGPAATLTLSRSSNGMIYNNQTPSLVPLAAQALSAAGGDQPHNNMQPYLTLTFIIALQGIFPARS